MFHLILTKIMFSFYLLLILKMWNLKIRFQKYVNAFRCANSGAHSAPSTFEKAFKVYIFFVLTTDLVSCYLVVQLCLSLSYQPHVVYDSPQLLVNNSNTLCHHSDLSAVAPFTLRTWKVELTSFLLMVFPFLSNFEYWVCNF